MRLKNHLLSTLILGASMLGFSAPANAEEFSLHLDPGVIQPLSDPQDVIYQTGVMMNARGMFNLTPWFSVGPSLSSAYLPKSVDNGSNAGVLWQFGAALRLQRNHDLSNTDGVSPYVNLDLMAAHTGNLWRPAIGAQVGLDMTTDQQHSFWFGPFIGYTHLFQTSNTQDGLMLDDRDPNMFTAGLSFTFDFPPRTRVVHDKVVETQYVTVTHAPEVKESVVIPEKLEFTQKVYFDWDKSVLRWESKDKLNEVIAKLNAHKDVAIHVQGHASSDGQKTHNEKLAAERAESVRQYLVSHGVDTNRLTVDNFGIDRPAADNQRQEGRERSRRVEFEVTFTSK